MAGNNYNAAKPSYTNRNSGGAAAGTSRPAVARGSNSPSKKTHSLSFRHNGEKEAFFSTGLFETSTKDGRIYSQITVKGDMVEALRQVKEGDKIALWISTPKV